MLKQYLFPGLVFLGGLPLWAQNSENHYATQAYDNSNVQAQIRLNLNPNENAVHFIRDNNDPYVVTKAYVLKYADANEIRPYIRTAVQANQITQDNTAVETAKLNDGTSILLVAAEEYRFQHHRDSLSIDEIVAQFDRPDIAAYSGALRFFYFPQYRNANELKTAIYNSGMTHSGDSIELWQGTDQVAYEPGLNALMFYTPQFSKKNIEEWLKAYDRPLPQATVQYTVYEIYDENDGKLGADFQSWKNNAGADLLSVGSRYRSNWASTWSGGIAAQSGSNKTEYFNFNPKWNTRYLDFLVSQSKAKIAASGEVVVKNNETATLTVNTDIFSFTQVPIGDQNLTRTATVTGTIYSGWITPPNNTSTYYFTASDAAGTAVTLSATPAASTSFSAIRITPSGNSGDTRYQLAVKGSGITFVKGGADQGTSIDGIASFALYQSTKNINSYTGAAYYTWSQVALNSETNIAKGNKEITTPGPAGYGFTLKVTPQINGKASILRVDIVNTSLLGWTSDGKPRIDKDGEVVTDVHVGNNGNRFIIGGISKRELVRSVAGVPYLREIPGLGWLFATESESIKSARLVVAAEVHLSHVGAALDPTRKQLAQENAAKLKNAGQDVDWGFGQYGMDSDKDTSSDNDLKLK